MLDARDMANGAYHAAKTAGRMLKAKGAHDTLIDTAHQLLGDALEIESAAKIRLADEYDAAQERGEISRQGAHVVGDNMSTADLGMRRDEIHDARRLRSAAFAYPGLVRRVVDAASGALTGPAPHHLTSRDRA